MAPTPVQIDLYSDVHCPYGYLIAFRSRKLRDEYQGRIIVLHRSLAVEYVNHRSTPNDIITSETPVLMPQEAKMGWETLKVEGSPTFVLSTGEQVSYFALPKVKMDPQQNYQAVRATPAPCSSQNCLDLYRQLFDRALSQENTNSRG